MCERDDTILLRAFFSSGALLFDLHFDLFVSNMLRVHPRFPKLDIWSAFCTTADWYYHPPPAFWLCVCKLFQTFSFPTALKTKIVVLRDLLIHWLTGNTIGQNQTHFRNRACLTIRLSSSKVPTRSASPARTLSLKTSHLSSKEHKTSKTSHSFSSFYSSHILPFIHSACYLTDWLTHTDSLTGILIPTSYCISLTVEVLVTCLQSTFEDDSQKPT